MIFSTIPVIIIFIYFHIYFPEIHMAAGHGYPGQMGGPLQEHLFFRDLRATSDIWGSDQGMSLAKSRADVDEAWENAFEWL